MAGILRVIKGVAASGALGKIDMHPGDVEASKIASLSAALSARTLVNNGADQQAGRDRASGAILTAVGVNSNWTKVIETPSLNNQPSIALATGSGNGIRFEAKRTLPNSYFIVMALSFTAAAISNTTGASQLLSRIGSDNTTLKTSIRRTGGNLLFTPNQAITTSLLSTPMSGFVADTPYILAWHWNNDTKVGRMYRNTLDTVLATGTNAAVSSNVAAGDHWDFLYGGNANVGTFQGNYADVYVFDEPIMDDDFGKVQAQSLFAALKTRYGIA